VGPGPEGGQGHVMPKRKPHPMPLSVAERAIWLGTGVFQGPIHLVTNTLPGQALWFSPRASRLVHGLRYGVCTLAQSSPQVAWFVPLIGKAFVNNILVRLHLRHYPKIPWYGLFVTCYKPVCDPSFCLPRGSVHLHCTATKPSTLLPIIISNHQTPSRLHLVIVLPSYLDRCSLL